MAFPPQYFFTLMEAAGRLGCTASQIVDWAIADEIDLVATFAPVTIGGEEIGGLMSVAGSEIRPLFRSVGRAEKKVCVRSVRPQGSTEWRLITSPAKGVKLTAGDIMITASEIERFEAAHGISRRPNVGPGAPSRYNWEGFYIALLKRLFTEGLPPRQKDLMTKCRSGSSRPPTTVMPPTRARFAAGYGPYGRNCTPKDRSLIGAQRRQNDPPPSAQAFNGV